MKNKDKKKSGANKEIKRPAHKKPRPKKYVEAKIPSLPPVPTEQVPITKEAPEPVVKLEIPEKLLGPQTSAERFVELLNKAAGELKSVANNLTTQKPRHPLPKTVFYKTGGIGAILRLETGADEYKLVEQIAEELKREAAAMDRRQEMRKAEETIESVEAVEDVPAPASEGTVDLKMWEDFPKSPVTKEGSYKKPNQNWFLRALRLFAGK